jgi:hypothetical protein
MSYSGTGEGTVTNQQLLIVPECKEVFKKLITMGTCQGGTKAN